MTPKECWEDLVVGANAAFRIVFSPKGELARTIKGILWAQKQMEEKDAEIARLREEPCPSCGIQIPDSEKEVAFVLVENRDVMKRLQELWDNDNPTYPTPKPIVGKLHGG